ncbi:hypothetical protein T484DRAFT_1918386 [Baffinella frigidus]|nr:hypothetical protein T484DRAFT_1918386 [Cryptophyta sp. CCMP2293]
MCRGFPRMGVDQGRGSAVPQQSGREQQGAFVAEGLWGERAWGSKEDEWGTGGGVAGLQDGSEAASEDEEPANAAQQAHADTRGGDRGGHRRDLACDGGAGESVGSPLAMEWGGGGGVAGLQDEESGEEGEQGRCASLPLDLINGDRGEDVMLGVSQAILDFRFAARHLRMESDDLPPASPLCTDSPSWSAVTSPSTCIL